MTTSHHEDTSGKRELAKLGLCRWMVDDVPYGAGESRGRIKLVLANPVQIV